MKTVIHTLKHTWYSYILGSEIVVGDINKDVKSSFVTPMTEWDQHFQIYFAAGYEIDQWDEVDFGSESDDEDYLIGKFFGQETPIFMNGFTDIGAPLPSKIFGAHSLNGEDGLMFSAKIVFNSEEEFWNQVRPLIENALLKLKTNIEEF